MATRNSNTNVDTGYWEEAFYNAYKGGFIPVLQEHVSVYDGNTAVDVLEGESKAYDFVGELNLVKKATRFEDLPLSEAVHNRRWISPEFYRNRIFVDSEDEIALMTDPTSSYFQAYAKGITRIKNDVVYNSFNANVRGGEVPGDDTYVLSDTIYVQGGAGIGRTIVHDAKKDFSVGGTSTGLTIEKLILTRQALVELFNDPNEVFQISCSPQQVSDLLREAETQSLDTNVLRSLVAGEVRQYMGFMFNVDHNVVSVSSGDIDADTDIFPCYAWSKDGILFAQNQSPIFKVDWHIEKQLWQLSVRAGMNAARMDEDKVIKIECAA